MSAPPAEIEWQTYTSMLDNSIIHRLWSRAICPAGIHLFDEVKSSDSCYLYCDACGRTWTAWERNEA